MASVMGVLLAAGLVAATARADDDPSGRVGRVAEVTGEVRTVNPEGAWVSLPRNQPLSTGDRVITDKDGHATIEIGSSTVRVGAYSDMSIKRLDDQKIFLRFDRGQMAVRVRSADILGELTIETDEGTWVPHHAGYYRFDRVPGQVLAAQAWTGDMLLEAPDSSLPVAANQRVEVWREGAQQATHYRVVPVPVDAFSDWALVQDRLDDRYAAAAGADATQPAAVPAEMTGGADLSRYGQWSSSPDYGAVWTPNDLPPDWAPYQAGSWSWISPWGWTWVDDCAWGFAPFHYGRWVSLRGRWAWTPGHWKGRPVYAPALVGWFGGAGFAVRGAPAVGWVPLAPGEAFYPGYGVSARYWSAINGGRGVPPNLAAVGATKGGARFVPSGPVAWANRGVPGAVTIVAQASLAPHAPISAMQRPDRRRVFSDAGTAELAPPGPPVGHSAAATGGNVVKVPAGGAAAAAAVPATATAPAPALAGKGAGSSRANAPAAVIAARPGREPASQATFAPRPVVAPAVMVPPARAIPPFAPAPVAPRPMAPTPAAPPVFAPAPAAPTVPVAPTAPAAPMAQVAPAAPTFAARPTVGSVAPRSTVGADGAQRPGDPRERR